MTFQKTEPLDNTLMPVSGKIRQYFTLLKFRLTALVVFSGAFGFAVASNGALDQLKLWALVAGSFLITGAANTINQIIERDLDKLMRRTMSRPLPTGMLSVQECIAFTVVLAVAGTAILALLVNPFTAALALLSMILYGFVYTPLKQMSPIAVFVGAFPGALPPLIGWVAATNSLGAGAYAIFAVQFMWQFPHFWSIAWLGDEDYRKAGFKMLPTAGGKNYFSALQIMIYTLCLIPIGLMPMMVGISGVPSAVIATFCGTFFLYQTFDLLKTGSDQAARKLMFSSFVYLPIVQISYLVDKL